MKIIPLSEGSFTIDATKLFVPFDEEQHVLNERPTGSLLVEIQPFVVITDNDILLLDTGLGFDDARQGGMQLHTNLRKAGIQPEEITKVLLSHLHKDHAGGVSLTHDHTRLALPNASYFVQKRELDYAIQKGAPSFIPQEIEALQHSGQVQFLHDDKGTINASISYEHTGAHSPHHQVFWIRENGQTVFFGGDDAPQYQQMKSRYVAKYDYNGKKCMQLRHEWWKKGTEEHWTFLFYHDIKRAVIAPSVS